jgi:hypothetical protein
MLIAPAKVALVNKGTFALEKIARMRETSTHARRMLYGSARFDAWARLVLLQAAWQCVMKNPRGFHGVKSVFESR